MANDLIGMGGLWINRDKKGNDYFSGGFGFDGKILIYKNTFKEKDSDPDYKMYIGKKEKKVQSDSADEGDIPF